MKGITRARQVLEAKMYLTAEVGDGRAEFDTAVS